MWSRWTLGDLGYDDLLLQDLHGVVGATRLLPHQNDFPEGAFAQKLQIVKVIHCLDEETRGMMSTNRVSIIQPTTAAALHSDWTSPFVCSGWWRCPSPPRSRSRSGRWGCTGCPPPPAWPETRRPSGWPRPIRPCRTQRQVELRAGGALLVVNCGFNCQLNRNLQKS